MPKKNPKKIEPKIKPIKTLEEPRIESEPTPEPIEEPMPPESKEEPEIKLDSSGKEIPVSLIECDVCKRIQSPSMIVACKMCGKNHCNDDRKPAYTLGYNTCQFCGANLL